MEWSRRRDEGVSCIAALKCTAFFCCTAPPLLRHFALYPENARTHGRHARSAAPRCSVTTPRLAIQHANRPATRSNELPAPPLTTSLPTPRTPPTTSLPPNMPTAPANRANSTPCAPHLPASQPTNRPFKLHTLGSLCPPTFLSRGPIPLQSGKQRVGVLLLLGLLLLLAGRICRLGQRGGGERCERQAQGQGVQ